MDYKELVNVLREKASIEKYFNGYGRTYHQSANAITGLLERAEKAEKQLAECKPVVRAHWIDRDHGYQMCSACGEEAKEDDSLPFKVFDYCPHCGAKMDEVVFDDPETVYQADDVNRRSAE